MTRTTFLAQRLAENIRERRKLLDGDMETMGAARALGHYYSDLATMLEELPNTKLVNDALKQTTALLAKDGVL